MRLVLQILSWIALALTVVPSMLFLGGKMELGAMKTTMTVATILWFVVTPMWMGREKQESA